jgi:Tol biopolymer transport system component
MNKRVVLSPFVSFLVVIGTSVLAGCSTLAPTGQSPTVPGAVVLTPIGSPTPLGTIRPTVPPATNRLTLEPSSTLTLSATYTFTPEPTSTSTPSASPTQGRLNLSGTVYLLFPPKSLDYPYSGNLYQVNPNIGQTSPLLTGGVRSFMTSPDGGQLAYVLRGVEGDQILVRNLVDRKDVRLFVSHEPISDLVWSPDGHELAFTQQGDIWWNTSEVWVVSLDDQIGRKIASGLNPAWSPDSQKLAYVTRPRVPPHEQNSLEIVDRTGKNRQVIFDTDPQTWKTGQGIDFNPEYGGPLVYFPQWSPDGCCLLFGVSANPVGLYRIQLDSGAVLKLISSPMSPGIEGEFVQRNDWVIARVGEPQDWSNLYSLVLTKQGEVEWSVINQDGDVVTCFALSPDKQYVAFVATDQEGSRINFAVYDLQAEKELLRWEIFGDIGEPHAAGCELEWAPQ